MTGATARATRRCSTPEGLAAVGFLEKMFTAKGIELRDIEQMMEMIATFVSVWPWGGVPVNLIALLPLAHKQHLNLREGEGYDHPILQQTIEFEKFDFGTPETISLEPMSDSLKRFRTTESLDGRHTNAFDKWKRVAFLSAQVVLQKREELQESAP